MVSGDQPLAFFDATSKLEEFDNDKMTKIAKAMEPVPFTPEDLIGCVTKLVNRANDEVQAWWKMKAWWESKFNRSNSIE